MEQFFTTVHIEIIGLILIPIVVIWIDLRREAGKNRAEIVARFTKLETMIQPLWDWWNNGRQ